MSTIGGLMVNGHLDHCHHSQLGHCHHGQWSSRSTHLLSLSEAETRSNCPHGIALPFSKLSQSGKKGAAHPKLCITFCHCLSSWSLSSWPWSPLPDCWLPRYNPNDRADSSRLGFEGVKIVKLAIML